MRQTLATLVSPACLAIALLVPPGAHAQAQPEAQPQEEPDPSSDPATAPQPDPTAAPETGDEPVIVQPSGDSPDDPYTGDPGGGPEVAPDGEAPPAIPDPVVQPADPSQLANITRPKKAEPLHMPIIFNAPTGHLLPAGIIVSQAGVDTAGGLSGDLRVGLGDVAEFGVSTNALINVKPSVDGEPEAIDAYPTALFKMGISENLLFRHQPALSLGFRKSFEVEHDDRKTRVAQLYMVASKNLGKRFRVHFGGVFWDASIEREDGTELALHDSDNRVKRQLRAFGGIEIEPLPKSQILLELHWVPEFIIRDNEATDQIFLTPAFSWGVRYELADWILLESGVRVPDIDNVNLIDAQIFGQVRLVTRRFRSFLKGLN